MNITIIGPGAIGVSLAYALANNENNVSLLVKQEHNNLIEQGKISIKEISGTVTDKRVKIITKLSKTDLVILAVKSYSVQKILNQLRNIDTPILCCQNGLQTLNILKKEIEPSLLSYLVTGAGSSKVEAGFSHRNGKGFTFIGQINGPNGVNIKNISNGLNANGIDCDIVKNIQDYVWLKAIINSAINPIATINRVKNGDLRKSKFINEVKKICTESTTIAEMLGVKLPLDPWKEIITILDKTAHNKCSMLQDIENHQETEIDAINGEFIRIASTINIDAKYNILAIDKVKEITS
jgi:2-dehydropantoate 2-reductase|tara:strand:- start:617 stop:1501 length:885 start_codon:yes stop_codon:yes gene_type:complete